MDGLEDRGRVFVMAATNLPDSLDPALRRPGRFDRELAFSPPNALQGREILKVHLSRSPLAPDVDLVQIADEAHGYVGADLAALAREASMAALNRAIAAAGDEARLRAGDIFLTRADLVAGLQATRPSALRDTEVETPRLSFADIGGLDTVKTALREAFLWPQTHRATFEALHIWPAAGVLLAGPPSPGKTLLARAPARDSDMNFIALRPARLLPSFLARPNAALPNSSPRRAMPCLVFLDEVDTLAPKRYGRDPHLDRILTEMDGISPNTGVTVLATTNRPNALDAALIRPERFDLVGVVAHLRR
jgi:transitional endoplasmic reticulum ATPase